MADQVKKVEKVKVFPNLVTKGFVNLVSKSSFWIKPARSVMDSDDIVNIKNLKISFRTTSGILHAVRGVDIKIKKGEIVGIVGESGSGKSVTVKSLIGFNPNSKTTADYLDFLNYDLLSFNAEFWKNLRGNQVGYIPQDPLTSLNPVHRIGKQLKEAYYLAQKRKFNVKVSHARKAYYLEKMGSKNPVLLKELLEEIKTLKQEYKDRTSKEVANKKIYEVLDFIGIKNIHNALKAYPHQFSGGMRQRIVIAMTVLGEPKLIIADEPTTALDVIVQAKVLDLLKQIHSKHNITVIFISHNIGLVANFCNYLYILYAGKIVEKGSVYEIFNNPRHPYTWSLISAIPDSNSDEELASIPGTPPNLLIPPIGDAFAPRNEYAIALDYELEPPLFKVSKSHYAATWLLHPDSPHKQIPEKVVAKLAQAQVAIANKRKRVLAEAENRNGNKTKNSTPNTSLNSQAGK